MTGSISACHVCYFAIVASNSCLSSAGAETCGALGALCDTKGPGGDCCAGLDCISAQEVYPHVRSSKELDHDVGLCWGQRVAARGSDGGEGERHYHHIPLIVKKSNFCGAPPLPGCYGGMIG